MEKKFDILVIGSGMAGAVAALKAVESGKKIAVIRKGYGSTALSSGAIDLAADPLGAPGRPLEDNRDWQKNMKEIARRDGFHPYAVLAADRSAPDLEMAQALNFIYRELQGVGLPLFPVTGKNLTLINPLGGFKFTGLAQESQGKGDLEKLKGKKTVILGVKNLPDFPADYIARALQESIGPAGYGPFSTREIEIPGFSGGTSFEAAAALEADGAEKLASALAGISADAHLIFPPILGALRARELSETLQKFGVMDFSESLAVPTSIPGFRLQSALDRALEKRGVTILNGQVISAGAAGHRVQSLQVKIQGQEEKLEGQGFILATGKYLGGGIERGRIFRELVFDLPVFIGEKPVKEDFIKDFLTREPLGPHPAFRAGIRVSGKLKPLLRDQQVFAENLWAAGSILAGYDSTGDGAGLGVAVLTGFKAGQEAGEQK
ncbi:MAG: FAD-dependent oxidoreductase [Proteobacteria bacterium]|nr:FAD-dependent oxidoreductase [Pseudomonadota bacterium]